MKKCNLFTKWLMFFLITLGTTIYSESTTPPKISIITSVYDADSFIEGFLADIVRQTLFNRCELIIINADSPGNEEVIIKKYLKEYDNIVYRRLDKDPGLFAVWNLAIGMSRGEYITNANVDDRVAANCYEVYSALLEADRKIDLVYSDRYFTTVPNQTFENHSGQYKTVPEFSKEVMCECLPGSNPMWRKSLHMRYGYFDESYKTAGDWEMWLRAAEGGALFKKIAGCYSLYYENPDGLSTGVRYTNIYCAERVKIVDRYGYMWGFENFYSMYRLGKQLEKAGIESQSMWQAAMQCYLKAFAFDLTRAEPLVRIAQYYLNKGNYALAYLFALPSLEIPMPFEDQPSVEDNVYTYIRYDIIGIAAWYLGEFEKGEWALRKALDHDPENRYLQENLKFYVNRRSS